MARSRTRRRSRRRSHVGRSRSGRFVSVRHRAHRRRRRQNPSGFIKVGRRWKKITKYARRRRKGHRRGQISGFKFPKRYHRRRRHRVHRNPVVVSNPRRRRHHYGHHRRYVRHNPAASYRLSSDPVTTIKNAIMSAFSPETLTTILHMGVGAVGSMGLSKYVISAFPNLGLGGTAFTRVGSTFASSILLTAASALLKDARLTARVLTGGLLTTAWQALSEAVAGTPAAGYIPTLSGPPETEEFRKAIEAEVLKELRAQNAGTHGYLPAAGSEGFSTYLQPAGIEYLRPAGSEAYLTQVNTRQANSGMGAFLTQDETHMANAGVGGEDDEFSRHNLPERF